MRASGGQVETFGAAFGIRTAVVLSTESALRRTVRVSLETLGLRVRELDDFGALFERPDRGSVDLVLYDVRDPPRDAQPFARRLRRSGFPPHLGVLVLSTPEETPLALEALEQGADDVISVPFHQVVFRARVRATLNRSILYEKYRRGIEALRESRHELATAIESMSYAFALFGPEGDLRLANERFYALYPATTCGRETTLRTLLRAMSGFDGSHGDAWNEETIGALVRGKACLVRTRGGRVYEIRGSATPTGGLVTAHEDVTERVRDEERLRHLALHDPLTGLANRVQFEEELERALHGARRGDERFALLYVDLDGFKAVNDALGHQTGDDLLVHVARLLRETVREGDLVARLGGDEFAVLSRNPPDEEGVRRIGERLFERLGRTFPAGPAGVPIGLSIGAVIHREGDGGLVDGRQLIARADAAMYAAKRKKTRSVVFFESLEPRGDQSNLGARFS
ncbi:MAG: diguanylate cyclase [Myxococcales bacterium]|nr:diguanylate cyclase [Myxococcales bacterium]